LKDAFRILLVWRSRLDSELIHEIEPPTEEAEEQVIGMLADDIERQSHDFVLKQLSAK
jgi:hypothetical protein